MIFRPELVDKVVAATKTQTRRRMSPNPNSPWYRERCQYKAGREYAVQPGRGKTSVAHIRVDRVEAVRLDALTPAEARAEGFETVEQFQDYWRSLHGGKFPGHEWVWMLEFTVTERAEYDRQHALEIDMAVMQVEQAEDEARDAKLRERPHESRYDG